MGRGASPWSQQPETLEGDGPSKSPKKQKALVAKKIKTIITQKSRKKEKTRVKKAPSSLLTWTQELPEKATLYI